jgi:hypothetical protein
MFDDDHWERYEKNLAWYTLRRLSPICQPDYLKSVDYKPANQPLQGTWLNHGTLDRIAKLLTEIHTEDLGGKQDILFI